MQTADIRLRYNILRSVSLRRMPSASSTFNMSKPKTMPKQLPKKTILGGNVVPATEIVAPTQSNITAGFRAFIKKPVPHILK